MKTRFLTLTLTLALAAPAAPMLPGYLTDAGAGKEVELGDYRTPDHLKYPYVSTYYVEPTVREGSSVRIGYYVTDWNHSKARAKDDSARFDVTMRWSADGTNWCEKVAYDVKTGDGEIDLGVLARGAWTLSVEARDRRSGLPSGVVWHDFRVVSRDFGTCRDGEWVRVTSDELKAYGVVRLDSDYERIVPVPVDAAFANRRDNWQKRAAEGLRRVEAFLAAHPHADAARPGYAVYVPAVDGVPVNRAFEMVRLVRDAGYDTNAVACAARATREGLQRLLDEKRAAGVRKVTLPRGVYRVDETPVTIPSGLTLDLGGATVKLNGFAGCRALTFRIGSGSDAALENGVVEGDYFEHDYANSPNHSEWVCGWEIDSAAWYAEVRDVVTRNVTGYGGSNGAGKDAPGDWLTYAGRKGPAANTIGLAGKSHPWTPGGYLPDGRFDGTDTARWTSRAVDVTGFVPFKYLTVSKMLGYQGIRTRNWNLTVAYFGVSNAFLKAEVVSQYRVSRLPPGARTARFSIEVASQEEAQTCDLTVMLLKIPQNGAIRRCRFERCRAVGYAMSACRNWLLEDCEFLRSGEALATCAFDAEDGWDGMQDVTFRRNRFHDNPNNDFLTCAGHNFVYEGNVGAIHLWPRTYSPCIRSNDCTTASFCCANRNRTGYGRYDGNVYRKELSLGGSGQVYQDWNIVFDGYDFRSASTNARFRVQSSGTGLFRNCTFVGVEASPGAAEGCTLRDCRWTWARWNSGTWRDCTVENCAIPRVNATNLYERCTFRNVWLTPARWGAQFFRHCTLEGVTIPTYSNRQDFDGCLIDCKVSDTCRLPDVLTRPAAQP